MTPPLVLVHGWAGSPSSWASTVSALSSIDARCQTHPVALPHAPGGRALGSATVPEAVDTVIGVLEQLDHPAVLVGHSMGAQVTLLTQTARPDLVLAEVVLDPAYNSRASKADIEGWVRRIDQRGHSELEAFFSGALNQAVPRADRDAVMRDFHATPVAAISSYLRSEYTDPGAIGLRHQTTRAARRRTRPVLAVHTIASGAAAERALQAPGGSAVELWPGHCHFLHLQSPVRTAQRLLEWRDGQQRDREWFAPEHIATHKGS